LVFVLYVPVWDDCTPYGFPSRDEGIFDVDSFSLLALLPCQFISGITRSFRSRVRRGIGVVWILLDRQSLALATRTETLFWDGGLDRVDFSGFSVIFC
jgi:hypothetical protein